jgi:hypothetical protein
METRKMVVEAVTGKGAERQSAICALTLRLDPAHANALAWEILKIRATDKARAALKAGRPLAAVELSSKEILPRSAASGLVAELQAEIARLQAKLGK